MVTDSINQARQRGASDDQIVQEILRQNPQKSASFQEAQRRGASSAQILDEIVKQNSQPVATPQKEKSFLSGELMGGSKNNSGGVLGFVKDVFQGTVGSRGLGGIAQMPGRVAGEAGLQKETQGLTQSLSELAKTNALLIRDIRSMPAGERKNRLLAQVKKNSEFLTMAGLQQSEMEDMSLTPTEALGTAANAALTVAAPGPKLPITGGLGAVGKYALKQGALGTGMGVAGELSRGESVEDSLKTGAASGVISALTGGLTAKTFQAIQGTPIAKLFESAIGLTGKQKDISSARAFKGSKRVGEIAMKYAATGAKGSLKDAYSAGIKQAKQIIKTELENSDKTVDGILLKGQIWKNLFEEHGKNYSPKQIRAMLRALPIDGLKGKGISMKALNEIRDKVDNGINFLATSEVESLKKRNLKIAREVLADFVKKAVPATKEAFDDESGLLIAMKALSKDPTLQSQVYNSIRSVLGLGGVGYVGGVLGGPAGAVVGAGVGALSQSTLGKTAGVQALKQLGIATKKLSESEIARLVSYFTKMGIIQSSTK